MKTLLICHSIFAALMLSAAPQILFDSDLDTKLGCQEVAISRPDDGTICVTKTSPADWGGFYLPRVSTSGLEGKAVRISGHVQVKSLNNTCQRRAIVKGIIWFENKERATWKERIGSDSFFSLTEAGKEVAFDKTVPVPQNVKYMIAFLHFGYATGEFVVKDLKVETVSADNVK